MIMRLLIRRFSVSGSTDRRVFLRLCVNVLVFLFSISAGSVCVKFSSAVTRKVIMKVVVVVIMVVSSACVIMWVIRSCGETGAIC